MATLAKASPVPTGPALDNRRIAAAVIDLLVPLAGVAVGYAAGLSLTRGLLLVGVGWTLYYFFALESGDGQTLGKRAMGLRVVSADGTPATMEQIAKRTVVRILDGHVVGLIVMLATGERRQRLGDIVAGTVVTEAASTAGEADRQSTAEEPAHQGAALEPARAKQPFFKRDLSLPSFGRKSRGDKGLLAAAPLATDPGPDHEPAPLPEPSPLPKVAADAPAVEHPEPVQADLLSDAMRAAAPQDGELDVSFDDTEPSVGFDDLAPDGGFDGGDETGYGFEESEAGMDFEYPEPSVELDRPEPLVELDSAGPLVEPAFPEPSLEPEELHGAQGLNTDHEVELDPAPSIEFDSASGVEGDSYDLGDGAGWREPGADSADDEEADLTIKPVETVSAIDLVMQDAEERRPAGD